MSDYIKREDAIKEANTWSMFGNDNLESRLKRLPSADVVEVVRCKDCIHYDEHSRWQCDKFGQSVNTDDYCSYGERKEREHD